MGQRVGGGDGGTGRKREKTESCMGGQTSFLTAPHLTQSTETRLSDRLYSGVKAASPFPAPRLPTHRTPLGWGWFFIYPKGLLSKPMGTQRWGVPEPAGRQQPTPPTLSVEQTSTVRVMSSVELRCKGQEGPRRAVTDGPTAFPFQRGFSQGWCLA